MLLKSVTETHPLLRFRRNYRQVKSRISGQEHCVSIKKRQNLVCLSYTQCLLHAVQILEAKMTFLGGFMDLSVPMSSEQFMKSHSADKTQAKIALQRARALLQNHLFQVCHVVQRITQDMHGDRT